MSQKIRVLVVDDTRPVRETIKTMLELEGGFLIAGEAGDGEEAVRLARKLRPDAILMDSDLPGKDGITATAEILAELTTQIIIVSAESDLESLRQAMRAGAKDFLVKPFSSEDLAQAIRRCFREGGGKIAGHDKVITVFGTKGGVGKSTIAANLALALTLTGGDRDVALLDLDLEFGVQATMLGLRTRTSIVDLCRVAESLTPTRVREALLPVPNTSLSLLAAPPLPHLAAEVDGDARQDKARNYVEEIIRALREGWDFVVIDTAPNFREATLAALDLADIVLMVTTPDIPSLQNTAKGLNILLNQLEFSRDKLRVVLNQVDERSGLTADEVGHALDFPVTYSLPVDPAAVVAANTGQSLMTRRSRSQIGVQIGHMAELIATGGDGGGTPPGPEDSQGGPDGDRDPAPDAGRRKGLFWFGSRARASNAE